MPSNTSPVNAKYGIPILHLNDVDSLFTTWRDSLFFHLDATRVPGFRGTLKLSELLTKEIPEPKLHVAEAGSSLSLEMEDRNFDILCAASQAESIVKNVVTQLSSGVLREAFVKGCQEGNCRNGWSELLKEANRDSAVVQMHLESQLHRLRMSETQTLISYAESCNALRSALAEIDPESVRDFHKFFVRGLTESQYTTSVPAWRTEGIIADFLKIYADIKNSVQETKASRAQRGVIDNAESPAFSAEKTGSPPTKAPELHEKGRPPLLL